MSAPPRSINFACLHAKDFAGNVHDRSQNVYRSPGIEAVLLHLKKLHKPTLLDFGPLMRENVELFSCFHSKMFIGDFHQSSCAEIIEDLPPPGVDAVFCWDMFNYMSRTETADLICCLRAIANPGATLLMFAASSSKMLKHPIRFRARDRQHILCEPQTDEIVSCQPYTPRELESLMKGWKHERSLHLRNGLQEHLFSAR